MFNALSNFLERKFKIDAHYFLKGGFWLSLGQAVTVIFGLLTTVLFANILSESDFGVYKYLIGLAAIISTFSLTGLGQSILQAAAQGYTNFYDRTIGLSFRLNLPVLLISTVTAIYYFLNNNLLLSLGCVLIAFFQPLINTFQFIPAYLQGSQQFRSSAVLQSSKILFTSLVILGTIYITKNILIIFFVFLASSLFVNALSWRWYRTNTNSDQSIPEDVLKKYISYAKHTTARNIIANIAYRLDTIIVFTQLGAAELAIYTIANIIPEQLKGSVKNVSALLLPKYAQNLNSESIKKNIPKRSAQLLGILILISLAYIAAAPLLFSVIFPKYTSAVFLSQLVALSLPASITILPISFLQSRKKERALYSFNLFSSLILVLLTIVLTLTLGLIGAILARIISRYCNLFLSFYNLWSSEH